MGMVSDFVAPPFKVKRSSDKYAEYTKSVLRVYDNKISGRERPKEIDWNVTSSTYSCEEYALSGFVSDREMDNADQPINLMIDTVKQTQIAQELSREKRVTDIAANNALFTSDNTANKSGAWSTASSGTPVADFLDAKKKIWNNTAGYSAGGYAIVPLDVALTAIQTDEWKDYFKYTDNSKKDLFDFLTGLRNIGIEAKVAGSHSLTTYENTASDPASEGMWGENVLIFHREPAPTLKSRTFMYSPYRRFKEVERYRIKGERGETIDLYEDIDELLVDQNCGYLYTNTI
jgi:hypothetical protein